MPELEIVGIEEKTLHIAKRGGTWPYKLKGELSASILTLLQERAKQGWNMLAIGNFRAEGKDGKLLILEEVRL